MPNDIAILSIIVDSLFPFTLYISATHDNKTQIHYHTTLDSKLSL